MYLVSLCASLQAFPQARADENTIELGQRYTALFFSGDYGVIWQQMNDEMRATLGREAALGDYRRRVSDGAGAEVRVIRETLRQQGGAKTYLRYSLFDKSQVPVLVAWSFDAQNRIAAFQIRPEPQPAATPYLDYQTRARLRLPFDGEWFVFWGGRSIEQNYHAAVSDQRFAYDFVVIRDGASHRGDGTRESHYFCWGRPVLAPAKAKVLTVERLLADNPPGVMDAANPAGNHLILDLGDGEYALLAHLKANSISVEKGDDVEPGQTLGECGNSGNTSEPHLHFHLQDHPEFGEGGGLPAYFHDYTADGERVERGEPLQGQTVAPRRKSRHEAR
jgi:murein DD-endopeptidase MepM/ murein hydrolase activator NlpD